MKVESSRVFRTLQTIFLAFAILFAPLMLNITSAQGATLCVDPANPTCHATIQAAINAAAAGDTINVAAGTYNESPNINKSLSLIGAGRDSTFIQLQTGPTYLGSLQITNPAAEDVTISGFTIIGRDANCVASVLGTSNIIITTGVDNVTITNNRIRVGAAGACTNGDDGFGIINYYTTTASTLNLTVEDNIFEPLVSAGTRVYYINPGVVNFTFRNNQVNGVFTYSSVTQAQNGLVEYNTISVAGATCQSVTAFGSWGYPDAATWGHTTYAYNTFNNTYGLVVYSSQNVDVLFNTFNYTNYGLRVIFNTTSFDASTVHAHYNQFNGVCSQGISNTSGAGVVDGTRNWWGAANGPSSVGSGSGANVTTEVLYDPFCSTAGCGQFAPQVMLVDSTASTADHEIVPDEQINLGITSLIVEFTEPMYDPAGNVDPDDVTNPANYALTQLPAAPIVINGVTYDNGGGGGPYTATLLINDNVPLPVGDYELTVFGTTSVINLAGLPLAGDPATIGTDFNLAFSIIAAPVMAPSTGFAPGMITRLPLQSVKYSASSLSLSIPALKVEMDIVGVPLGADGKWDVTWLGSRAGWLSGSAYPTFNGNSVITGHVWDALNRRGPFYNLGSLKYGDRIIVNAWGSEYVYEVRQVLQVSPSSISALMKHQELPWLTLVTCKGYNAETSQYDYRTLVRAVLIEKK